MKRTNFPKRAAWTLLVLGLGIGTLAAAPPRKQPIGRYATLWTKSPFTVKPPPPVKEELPDALEDYVLTGVSKLPEGYFVVLMNKKKRDERIRLAPGDHNAAGFKVVKVTQDPYDYKLTEVEISVNGSPRTGTVTYDEKLLAVKTPSPASKASSSGKKTSSGQKTPQVPGMKSKTPTTGGPRVRRLPTPTKR